MVDGARRLPHRHRPSGPAVLAARGPLRPARRGLRAAVAAVARPVAPPRRSGVRGRDGCGARLPPRPPAPRIRLGRGRVRAGVPPASGDAVARARRLPSGRARDAAPSLGVLVPRQRAARSLRPHGGCGVPDEGADRAGGRRDGPLVRAASRREAGWPRDRRGGDDRVARRRVRGRAALRAGRRLPVRRALRVRRRVAGRDGQDRDHGPRRHPRRRERRPRPRVPRRPPPTAPRLAAPRAARGADRAPGARAQPPVGHAHADLDPLPLHGRRDSRPDGRGGARRGTPATSVRLGSATRGTRDRGLDGDRRHPPRPTARVVPRPVRVRPRRARARRRAARRGRGARPPLDPAARRREREQHARRAPLGAPAGLQLPRAPGGGVDRGRPDAAEPSRPGRRTGGVRRGPGAHPGVGSVRAGVRRGRDPRPAPALRAESSAGAGTP